MYLKKLKKKEEKKKFKDMKYDKGGGEGISCNYKEE